MSERDRGPGVVYYKCDECGADWIDVTRDDRSPSCDMCYCGYMVTPVQATTEQFDTLKRKRTPLGHTPVGYLTEDTSKLLADIRRLNARLEEVQLDYMYCPNCACQSCAIETERRKVVDIEESSVAD